VSTTSAVTLFFALLAVAAQLALATLATAALAARHWRRAERFRAAVAAAPSQALGLAFLVSLVATLGSLYLSEVAGLVPCTLCWYQRAAMYPLALLLGLAAWRRDLAVRPYAVALAATGGTISVYHHLLERFPALDAGACDPDNPCTLTWVWQFHYLSVPLMAGTAFALVIALLLSAGPAEGRAVPEGVRGVGRRASRSRSTAAAGQVRPQGTPQPAGGRVPGALGRLAGAVLARPGGGLPLLRVALVVIVVAALAAGAISGRGGGEAGAASDLPQARPLKVSGEPLPSLGEGGADPAVGRPAPELRGASFDGAPLAITRDGTPKALVFLAHWCPHCRAELPVLVRWLDNGRLPAGVRLYAVSTAVRPDLPAYPPSGWLRQAGWPTPVLADDPAGSAASAFGLSGYPFFVLVDGRGQVVARASGEQSPRQLDRLLERLAPDGR
jgi:disulfide bond formation protein DsbB/thiol-disulfide isomerase/thioredoxin